MVSCIECVVNKEDWMVCRSLFSHENYRLEHVRLYRELFPVVTGVHPDGYSKDLLELYLGRIFPDFISSKKIVDEHALYIIHSFRRHSGIYLNVKIPDEAGPLRWLTAYELKRLFDYRRGELPNVIVRLLYSRGLLLNEVLGLRVRDFDPVRWTFQIKRKNGAVHILKEFPVVHSLQSDLERIMKRKKADDPLFSVKQTSQGVAVALTPSTVNRFLDRASNYFLLGNVKVIMIRNAFALNMMRVGISPDIIRSCMGMKTASNLKPHLKIAMKKVSLPDSIELLNTDLASI